MRVKKSTEINYRHQTINGSRWWSFRFPSLFQSWMFYNTTSLIRFAFAPFFQLCSRTNLLITLSPYHHHLYHLQFYSLSPHSHCQPIQGRESFKSEWVPPKRRKESQSHTHDPFIFALSSPFLFIYHWTHLRLESFRFIWWFINQ